MNNGGTHIVVTPCRALCMFMFNEFRRMSFATAFKRHPGYECVRLGDFVDGFKVAGASQHSKNLACTVVAHRLDRDVIGGQVLGARKQEAEVRRHVFFNNFERQETGTGLQFMGFAVIMAMVGMGIVGTAVVMAATAKEKNARNIDYQTEDGDWDRLIEADRNRPNEPRERLVADEKGDHSEDDGT